MDIKDSISYFLKQNNKQCHGARKWLNFIDYPICAIAYKCGCRDYFCGTFYEKTLAQRKNYITQFRKDAMVKKYNDLTLGKKVDDKASFDQMFQEYLHRDFLFADEASLEEFEEFAEKHPVFFVKAVGTSGGKSIWKCKPSESKKSMKQLFAKMKGCILEEPIIQHEKMSSLHPGTVNTIRVNTVWSHGEAKVFAAVLRIGSKGCVDNFHAGGGMGAEVDLETGVVFTTAINMENERFIFHPVTGTQIVGFQIPNWDIVLKTVKEMAAKVPTVRSIGWDIAVTEEGCSVVEGNNKCDFLICQMPRNIGRYRELMKLLEA